MTVALIVLALPPLVLLAVPVFVTYTSVRGLRDLALTPLPVPEPQYDRDGLWAGESEFEFVGHFGTKIGMAETHMAIWRRPDRPSFFCRYTVAAGEAEQTSYDFVTLFDGDVILTTNDRCDSQMLPLPDGYYCQSFSRLSLDEQWSRHIDAENYLLDAGGATLRSLDKPFEDCFSDTLGKQATYIASIPLWPVRGVAWFFVRRHLRHNRSISTQRDRGMICLPNEYAWFSPGQATSGPSARAADTDTLTLSTHSGCD
jgi:hypothetical protein